MTVAKQFAWGFVNIFFWIWLMGGKWMERMNDPMPPVQKIAYFAGAAVLVFFIWYKGSRSISLGQNPLTRNNKNQ